MSQTTSKNSLPTPGKPESASETFKTATPGPCEMTADTSELSNRKRLAKDELSRAVALLNKHYRRTVWIEEFMRPKHIRELNGGGTHK